MELRPLHIVGAQLIDGDAPRPGSLLAVGGRIAALNQMIPLGPTTAAARAGAPDRDRRRCISFKDRASRSVSGTAEGLNGRWPDADDCL